MAWAIITIYISKCAQMNPQQLPKTSKFYSKCKKCDIEKTLGGGYHPLGSPKVKRICIFQYICISFSLCLCLLPSVCLPLFFTYYNTIHYSKIQYTLYNYSFQK